MAGNSGRRCTLRADRVWGMSSQVDTRCSAQWSEDCSCPVDTASREGRGGTLPAHRAGLAQLAGTLLLQHIGHHPAEKSPRSSRTRGRLRR
eukprot:2877070-Prymnesium_polylepis.1